MLVGYGKLAVRWKHAAEIRRRYGYTTAGAICAPGRCVRATQAGYGSAVPLLHGEKVLLAVVCDLAIASGRRIVDPLDAEEACLARGLDHQTWFASVESLFRLGLVARQSAPPSQVVLLAITPTGLMRHLTQSRPDLDAVEARLLAAAARAQRNQAVDLAGELGEPALLVEALLDRLVDRHRVVYSKAPGRRFRVHRVKEVNPVLPGAPAAAAEPAAGEAPSPAEPAGP